MGSTKRKMRTGKKVALSLVSILLIALLAVIAWFFIRPQIKVAQLESTLTMDTSPTAEYIDLMADTDTVFSWCTDLVNLGERRPGTEAGTAAQQYVYDAFVDFGLNDVEIIESETTLYVAEEYTLEVGGSEAQCYYMNYTGIDYDTYGDFSNAVTDAEIVYVNAGEESDFENVDVAGKIVLCDVELTEIPIIGVELVADLFYDPNNELSIFESKTNPYGADFMDAYNLAAQNGAVGFVGVLTNYIDSCIYNNENLAYSIDYNVEMPGVWVSNTTGDTIKAAIEGGATASLTLSGSYSLVGAGAVIGYVYGQSEETIMVESHYDSVTTGAVEDASGCATMMAIANFYAQLPQEALGRTIMFVAMDTHFTDYDSHDAVIDALFGDDCNILCNLAVEHIALEVEENDAGEIEFTGEVEPRIVFVSENDTLVEIATEEIIRHNFAKTVVLPATIFGDEVPTDADMYFQEGVPIINLISGPIYLYDEIDTIDKVAKDELVPTAEVFSDILFRLLELDAAEFES